jgi:hypothetical protein
VTSADVRLSVGSSQSANFNKNRSGAHYPDIFLILGNDDPRR